MGTEGLALHASQRNPFTIEKKGIEGMIPERWHEVVKEKKPKNHVRYWISTGNYPS